MHFYTSAIKYGNNILFRGVKNGNKVKEKVAFSPTLYINKNDKTSLKTLYGDNVAPVNFESISEANDFIKRYSDVDGFDICGMTDFAYQYISDEFPGEIEWDISNVSIWGIDIETASENGFPHPDTAKEEILLISIFDFASQKNIVFGSRPYDKETNDNFEYREYNDEKTMLKEFVIFWQLNYPDNVTGWNVDGFDIPYIINRLNLILGENFVNKLSPWGVVKSREITVMKKAKTVWNIFGVNVIDYLDLYRKFTYSSRESYTLDFICDIELGESKHAIEGSFRDAYTKHWNDFVRYNARDTELIFKLEQKLKFVELLMTVAFLAKCHFNDVFGQVKVWDIFIYNYLKSKNIIIPPHKRKHGGDFEGAWVKDPSIGFHGWTVSFDFASLYPSIIRQWNMSPETIEGVYPGMTVDKFISGEQFDAPKNVTIAANGAMFRKNVHGIIPEVIKIVIDGRKIAKKKMQELEKTGSKDKHVKAQIASLNAKQMAFKIMANALYGAISNAGFRYFDLRIAEAITLTGQASDRFAETKLNEYMNKLLKTTDVDYVLAGDTDSLYLNVDPLVRKVFPDKTIEETVVFLDKVCSTKIQEQINGSIDTIYQIGNCYEKIMDMKREVIASKAIWTAKKRYAMMIHNSEGIDYRPYKMKIMGMDLIKSSTPHAIRSKLKEALVVIFEKDQEALFKFIDNFKNEFVKMKVEDISFPRGVSDIEKYSDSRTLYKSGCPIHNRAALLYNKLSDGNPNLVKIRSSDKIKFVYLKLPNIIREDVIGFLSHSTLPPEFNLHKFIDHDKMWESVFISPLKGITDSIGWQVEKKSTLEGFFS
jgi:DNA polymerase elongation subunit (family B)